LRILSWGTGIGTYYIVMLRDGEGEVFSLRGAMKSEDDLFGFNTCF
jgi:hypothetical protein